MDDEPAVVYGGSAGPGLLTRIADAAGGLFLGRFAHDPAAFGRILDEALWCADGAVEDEGSGEADAAERSVR